MENFLNKNVNVYDADKLLITGTLKQSLSLNCYVIINGDNRLVIKESNKYIIKSVKN